MSVDTSVVCRCFRSGVVDPDAVVAVSEEEQVLLVVEVGLVGALLDDSIPEGEARALATAIRLLPGLRDLTDEQLNIVLSRAGHRASQGDTWLCEVATKLTHPGLRRVAFRMASMFCAWDGTIDDKEQGYLDFLANAFGYSVAEADSLFAQATGQFGTASSLSVAPEVA